MARVRKIHKRPKKEKNYYLVDACFLVNKYIPIRNAPTPDEKARIRSCMAWWQEIEAQLAKGKARVYVPDLCVAEAFKVLAKKYYEQPAWFKFYELDKARKRFVKDITVSPKALKARDRVIRYHDISTSRDIIIAVDRFYELFLKHEIHVGLPDLIILATAKYLMDFFDIPKGQLHIVTLDRNLRRGSQKISELPNAYDPTLEKDAEKRIFK